MPQAYTPRSRINITVDVEQQGHTRAKELPLKLLVLGNFSNHCNMQPQDSRQRYSITHQSFNHVMSELSPRYTLPDTPQKTLVFKSLQDFLPDALAKQHPKSQRLLAMRNILSDLKLILSEHKSLRLQLMELLNHPVHKQRLQRELTQNSQ